MNIYLYSIDITTITVSVYSIATLCTFGTHVQFALYRSHISAEKAVVVVE